MQRILVVEDEPSIADNITYALQTEGFAVDWCATAEEALRILASSAISLVVLDVGLPDRNGFDLCRDIRRTSEVPIIFLTARSAEVDRVVGLEIGADDYMPKPFSPRELAARVRAVLRRAPKGEAGKGSPPLRFAVDAQRMRISYCGETLDLSRYEYRLLELLLRRPGWVFSREQIMEHVWEEPESSMDRTVDTHVKTIRAKLRRITPDIDPIQTHRGLGYSLKETP
ncbi:MAG: two-component system response regulator CreB [Candidatus Hydrogenedentes bacterium]|nr:two-component system response regulator CreB [Candidatus Hydrogenedentota bacterium]